jgi:hypothetical protein
MRKDSLIVLFALGCGRIGFDGSPAPDSSGTAPDSSASVHGSWSGLGPFSQPRLVSELFSGHDHAAAMTGDMLEVFFESGATGNDDVWYATRSTTSSTWNAPTRVDELSTIMSESAIQLSANGLEMWFTREKVLQETSRATRTSPWLPPRPSALAAMVTGTIYNATPTSSMLAMIVQVASGGTSDLHIISRASPSDAWGSVRPLDGVNTSYQETTGTISDDLLCMYFASNRPGGRGLFDLYFATRDSAEDPFTHVELVAELSSADIEYDPWISADGRVILFAGDRGAGGLALYEARR